MPERSAPLVSVIIPVYNVAQFLPACLDSAIGQTLKELEIICVNDGSTDSSPDILREYAAQDARIRVVDQENRGLSGARNTGAKAAAGKYLYFLDSDDWLDPDAMRLASDRMERDALDFCCFNAVAVGEEEEMVLEAGSRNASYFSRLLDEEQVCSGLTLFTELKENDAYVATVWASMIRRDYFLRKSLWFLDGIYHEDEPWTFAALTQAERAGCLNRVLYYYRIRKGSIISAKFSFKHVYGLYAGCQSMEALIPELSAGAEERTCRTLAEHVLKLQMTAINRFMKCSEEEKRKADSLPVRDRLAFHLMIAQPAKRIQKDSQTQKKTAEALKREIRRLREENSYLWQQVRLFQNSRAFLVGRYATWPLRRLKRALQKPVPEEKNRMEILPSDVEGGRIVYHYRITGPWQRFFAAGSSFEITYPFDMADVPEGIRIVPLLSQVMPVAWLQDAEVAAPVCDRAFFECLEEVRNGYRNMYPDLSFRGALLARKLEDNRISENREKRAMVFFSGGVDSMQTTISHAAEKPILFALWGSDVFWREDEGWNRLRPILEENAAKVDCPLVTVRTAFRDLLREGELSKTVVSTGRDWWLGFQHGLGILGHAAPLTWHENVDRAYIAATDNQEDAKRAPANLASDPSIDNHVRFGGARVIHDGFEFNRQKKVQHLTEYAASHGGAIRVHVCWETRNGMNCCRCEKCWRTMLGLVVEGADPAAYGFTDFPGLEGLQQASTQIFGKIGIRYRPRFAPIQDRLRERLTREECPPELLWLYDADLMAVQQGRMTIRNGEIRKAVWLLGTPDYPNLGDHLIAQSEARFLEELLPGTAVREISEETLARSNYAQLKHLPPDQPVFLQGGGNLGNIWERPEQIRETVLQKLPGNPVIIFPQSIFFSDDENGRKALKKAKEIYTGKRILLCCRDRFSLSVAQKNFDCRLALVPDIALWFGMQQETGGIHRFGAVTMLRSDRERKTDDALAAQIRKLLTERFRSLYKGETILTGGIAVTSENREAYLRKLIQTAASAECVVTDRLHGMVLCAVTGTPCVVLDNSYRKVEGLSGFLTDLGYIRFVRDPAELPGAIDAVCACTDRQYPESAIRGKFAALTDEILARM